jgi:hypothetical protein
MKNMIWTLLFASVTLLANEATIKSTMLSMKDGMQKINSGFMYNSKADISDGLSTILEAHKHFKKLNMTEYVNIQTKQFSHKIINQSMDKHISKMTKSIDSGRYTVATRDYAKLMNDCVSCHTIIRGW